MLLRSSSHLLFLLLLLSCAPLGALSPDSWAVLVSTSRFWFNYRHTADALSVYGVVRRLGLPDDRILLLLADDMSLSAKNAQGGRIFGVDGDRRSDLAQGAEVDGRGADVTPQRLLRLLAGDVGAEGMHRRGALRSGPNSR